MMRALLVFSLLTLVACGDDDRPTADSGPAFDGGPGFDGGPFDAGPPFDGGAEFDAGPRPDAGPPSPLVDPSCTDGMYTEALPNVDAPIDDVAFSSLAQYLEGILSRRYPVGATLVREGRNQRDVFGGQECDVLFSGGASDAASALSRLNVIVHECGHFYDIGLSRTNPDSYYLTGDLTLICDRGDATGRGGDTFERSRLNDDTYSSMRPPCSVSSSGCDSYADVYLDGDPDDGIRDSGDQGFNLLFEEAVQYVNSLATEWAFTDQARPGSSTSAKDGILTFLWYIERYLHQARLEYPSAYERITDPCWRDAILTLWGRAWLYLQATEGLGQLGINEDAIQALVMDPELLAEIQRLRDLEGC